MAQVPKFRPQLATLTTEPPRGPRWLHELKLDGYRIACIIREGKVRLESRRNVDWTARFPEIVDALRALDVSSALLDGEVAIVLPNGLTSFQSLQNAFTGQSRDGLTYFVFDLLHLDGRNVASSPLEERKRECERLLAPLGAASTVRYSPHFDVDGAELLARVCALGGEGIISKRRDQPYRPGRGDGWLKSKCVRRETFVIGGFTAPRGSRLGLGALLVGTRDGEALRFSGKVGTGPGFTADYLVELRQELGPLEQAECPFVPPPPGWLGRHAHWVRPIRTGDVTFLERTDDGQLRHPSFQGLHPDATPVPAPGGASEAVPAPSPTAAPARRERRRRPPPGLGSPVSLAGIPISNPERPIYPELHFTKRDLAEFYIGVASWMLPYVANRPLTLVRCERGIWSARGLREDCRFLPHDPGWYGWAAPPLRRIQIAEQRKHPVDGTWERTMRRATPASWS